MGSYFSSYAGPYLKVEIVKGPVQIKKFGCELCKNDVWDRNNVFCSKHGKQHVIYTVTEQKDETYNRGYDELQGGDERLIIASHLPTREKFDIWIPNVSFLERETELEEWDVLELDKLDMQAEMAKFVNAFAKEMEALQKVYSKPLEVKWGVLLWKA